MTSARVRLNAQQAEDFALLAGVDPAKLRSVISSLEAEERAFLPPGELRGIITAAIGDDSARALLRQLISFGIGIRRKAFDRDIVDVISEALRERETGNDIIDQWEAIKDCFKQLLADKRIAHAIKSIDLSFDYANLFHGVRIITDCRPVFDDMHDTVLGTIVRHILRLSYTSVDARMTTLSLAIDRKELEEIRLLCDEALKKDATLTRHLSEPRATIKITPGDERDELS